MPLSTDLNVFPFFDDFNANNNYYRVLFRPSVPVQARELTQAQSILQDQIEKFGNWAFQNGDIVSGCNIIDMPNVPGVYLADQTSNGNSYTISAFVNTQVVSTQTGLSARVMYASSGSTASYPNTGIVYLSYNNTGNDGSSTFSNTDTLQFYNLPRTGANAVPIATVNVYSNSAANTFATINAHGIQVSGGVIFINGAFVNVLSPTFGLVNNYGTYAGNNVVGFTLKETIISSDVDPSLLDNALGYTNENAPGADRMQLIPTLTILSNTTPANNFNPIASYNYGTLVSKSVSNDVYSIVNDAIAQRIYDEAGNYVVNPPTIDTVSSIAGNSIVTGLSSNNVLARVNPFSGYAQGNYVNRIGTSYVNMRRGVDTLTNLNQQISFNYGGYLLLDEVAGAFDFTHSANVYFFANSFQSVTNRTFTSTPVNINNSIGTAYMRCFSYNGGTVGSNTAQYVLHIFDINMSNGYNTNQIASVYYANGTHIGIGDVISSGIVGASYDDQIYTFGTAGIKNLSPNTINATEYVYRNKSSHTLNVNGSIVVTLGTSAGTSQVGGVDILPYGANTTLSDLAALNFNVTVLANTQTANIAGTVTVTNGSNVVIGSSTNFINNFSIGSQIATANSSGIVEFRTVTSIANNTYLSVDTAFSNSSPTTAARYFPAGKQLTISSTAYDTPSSIHTTNTTSFTISTGFTPNTATAVDVTYDVLRTVAYPAKKIINKNRFVKINTANNPTGPWCLGFSDIHQVTAIYSSTTNSYSTSGANAMGQYVFDAGQKDTHYDLGYLYPTSSATIANNISLLVQLDYFSVNNAPGTGFFTIESYPIDDANTANTNAIQTQNIPVYVDGAGNRLYLRDYVDFRTPSVSTATDTGYTDITNATAISAAVSIATLNPSNTLTLAVSNNVNIPSYGKNLQANYTYYIPRKDLIIITPDNNNGTIKVKEGVSGATPQTPLFPDNSMALAVVNIPAYPSLTTDQLDAIYAVNKTSRNIIRDTSSAITTNIVTNRRYSMADIGKLDTRISDLEYYASLSQLEQTAANMTVTDANGLDRFKNGIFVDPFNDFSYSDISNPEFNIAIDGASSVARPKISREVVNIKFNSGLSSAVSTGRLVSLPYTSTAFLTQPYATQYRSAAMVAFAWNGTCILMPAYDNHVDTISTGSINVTVDNTTAWAQFANSAYSYMWGDWRTTTNTVSTSEKSESLNYLPPSQSGNITTGGSHTVSSPNPGYFYNGAAYAYNGDGSVVSGTSDSSSGDGSGGDGSGGDS